MSLFAILVVLGRTAHAAEAPLTLEECYRIANVQSPKLDESRARADLADWQATERLSGFLPSLNASGHYYFHERLPEFYVQFGQQAYTVAPPLGSLEDAEFALKVPLFDGFRNVDAYRAASRNREAARLDADWEGFRLRQQIRLAYFGVLSARQLAEAANANVHDLEEHRRLVNDQLRAGVTTRVALLRIDTQRANALSERLNAEDEVAIRTEKLGELLGETEERRPIAGELPEPDNAVLHQIEAAAPTTRPDIHALDLRSEASDLTHSANAKWWVPKVSFVGSYDLARSQGLRVDFFAMGLQANWAIFDGMASIAQTGEAAANARIARREHEASVLRAHSDFDTYRRRYRYNLEKYRAYQEDMRRSTESVHLARSGLSAGTQTNTDVLDAEQDLFDSRSRTIQSQYGALEALVEFENALGRNVGP